MTERGFGGPGKCCGPYGPQVGDATALMGLCAPPWALSTCAWGVPPPLGQPHPLEWGARHLGGGGTLTLAAAPPPLGRPPLGDPIS